MRAGHDRVRQPELARRGIIRNIYVLQHRPQVRQCRRVRRHKPSAAGACVTSELKISLTGTGALAGQAGGYLKFTNDSATPVPH